MNKQFSARLAQAIEGTGLNPTNFAYKAGVPQGTISKCLHGHVPTAKLLLRISKTSGKSVDWLLTGKEQTATGETYVAERAASYGRGKAGRPRKTKDDKEIWIAKLLKVLHSGSRREKQTVKDLLDVLSR